MWNDEDGCSSLSSPDRSSNSSDSSDSSWTSIPSSFISYSSCGETPPESPPSSANQPDTRANMVPSFSPSYYTSNKPAWPLSLETEFEKASSRIREMPSISKSDDHLHNLVIAGAFRLMTAIQSSSSGQCVLSLEHPEYSHQEFKPFADALQTIVKKVNTHLSSTDASSRERVQIDAARQATNYAYSLFDTAGPVYGRTEYGIEMEELLDIFKPREKKPGRIRRWFDKFTSCSSEEKMSRMNTVEEPSVLEEMADEAHEHYLRFRRRQPINSTNWQYRGKIDSLVETSTAAAKEAEETDSTYEPPKVSCMANIGGEEYRFPVSSLGKPIVPSTKTMTELGEGFQRWLSQRPKLGGSSGSISINTRSCGADSNLASIPVGGRIVY